MRRVTSRPVNVLLMTGVLVAACGSPAASPSVSPRENLAPGSTAPVEGSTVAPAGSPAVEPIPTPAGSPPVPTSSAALSAAPTREPVPSASPSRAPGDRFLGQVVVTVSDRLRVRSEPRVSDDSLKYEPLLPLGTELTVLDGPVEASGYVWYQVRPVSFLGLEGPGYGWVAMAGKDGEPWIWPSGVPHLPLSGHGTATVDGVLSPGEWPGAARLDFVARVPPRESGDITPASLYVMNDAVNLYLAVIVWGSFATETVTFEFDNDDDGVAMEDGDDVILTNFYVGLKGAIPFYDDFRYRCPGEAMPGRCGPADTDAGEGYPPPGTVDGAAAGSRTGGLIVVEMSHPLSSGDVAHDIQVGSGDAIGFVLRLNLWNDCGSGQCATETDLPQSGLPVTRILIAPA
jgi:hypothetical protein